MISEKVLAKKASRYAAIVVSSLTSGGPRPARWDELKRLVAAAYFNGFQSGVCWQKEQTSPRTRRVGRNPYPGEDPFKFHLKPSGWTGAPCPICGCTARNLRARHRALKADEAHRWGVPWIKRIQVGFGTDWSDEPIKG